MKKFLAGMKVLHGLVQQTSYQFIAEDDLPRPAGLTTGQFTLPTVTVDQYGRVIAIATVTVSGDATITAAGVASVNRAHLTDQAAPSAPSSGTLILQSFNQQGFSVAHLYDTQGNAIEITRDSLTIVRNTSGGTINKGQPVYVTGSTGAVPTVAKAKADSATTMDSHLVMYDTVANNAFGRAMLKGVIENFDTSAFSAGDALYVSSTTAGTFQNTEPVFPNIVQEMGIVLSSGVGNGSILVSPHPGEMSTALITAAGKTADITDTNIAATIAAGLYRIAIYLETTTGDGAAGAVTCNLKYTDDAQAETATVGPLALTVKGFVASAVIVRLASGTITYGTTHTGSYGSAVYSLYVGIEQLS